MGLTLQAILTYASVRVIAFVLLSAGFVFLFRAVIAKKSAVNRIVCVVLFAVLLAVVWFVPVESAFVRFNSIDSADYYMLPGTSPVAQISDGSRAVVMHENGSFIFLTADGSSWKAAPEFAGSAGLKRGSAGGCVVWTKDLGSGSGFVCVVCLRPDDPANGSAAAPKITDTNGAALAMCSRAVQIGKPAQAGQEYIYLAFSDVSSSGYGLIIDGQETEIQH